MIYKVVAAFVFILSIHSQAWSSLEKGIDAATRGDYETALELLRPIADEGNPNAQYYIGLVYYNIGKDMEAAADWFYKAATNGHANAQSALGVLYEEGTGVSKDDSKAAKWYQMAAEQGVADAQMNLAVFYHNGQGVQRDYIKAYMWYTIAIERGFEPAMIPQCIRAVLSNKMTPEQIAEANKLASKWIGEFQNKK
jgi:TPR repeat protein